jgi:hypothetical protein
LPNAVEAAGIKNHNVSPVVWLKPVILKESWNIKTKEFAGTGEACRLLFKRGQKSKRLAMIFRTSRGTFLERSGWQSSSLEFVLA